MAYNPDQPRDEHGRWTGSGGGGGAIATAGSTKWESYAAQEELDKAEGVPLGGPSERTIREEAEAGFKEQHERSLNRFSEDHKMSPAEIKRSNDEAVWKRREEYENEHEDPAKTAYDEANRPSDAELRAEEAAANPERFFEQQRNDELALNDRIRGAQPLGITSKIANDKMEQLLYGEGEARQIAEQELETAKIWESTHEPTTPEEATALDHWTKPGTYQTISAATRGEVDPNTEVREVVPAYDIERLDEAIARQDPAVGATTLYRSVSEGAVPVYKGLEPGQTIVEPGYSSTTPNFDQASAFPEIARYKDSQLLEIRAPEGTRGLDATPSTEGIFGDNHWTEVILPRGAEFKVLEQLPDRTVLEHIPPAR